MVEKSSRHRAHSCVVHLVKESLAYASFGGIVTDRHRVADEVVLQRSPQLAPQHSLRESTAGSNASAPGQQHREAHDAKLVQRVVITMSRLLTTRTHCVTFSFAAPCRERRHHKNQSPRFVEIEVPCSSKERNHFHRPRFRRGSAWHTVGMMPPLVLAGRDSIADKAWIDWIASRQC